MSELSEAKTAANAPTDASGAAADASNNAADASDPAEASSTADALAVVLEANLPTFVAGSTRIVGALRRCDRAWRDALGAHPATKRLFARCAACDKFAWRCSDCQGVAQPGEERRRGPPRDEVLCVDCRHVDICVEINQCVGCGRAARNRHRHAIEQASRRWRGGRRDDSARTRRKI